MPGGEPLIAGAGLPFAPAAHSGVQSVGVDLVDAQRLQQMWQRWGEPVLARLFTEQERSACRAAAGYRWKSLAGRFAAKEATKKVFGVYGVAIGWTEVEVRSGEHGQPILVLHGAAHEAAECLGLTRLLLSISHDANMAIAIVVAVA